LTTPLAAPGGASASRALATLEVGALLAGHDPEALVAAHGSPLFVYDLGVIRARVAALRDALPPGADVAYAVKANPSPAVLRTLAEMGLGADVASAGELRAVLRAGFAAERVVFTGPGKTDAELELALRERVGALTLESLDELDALLGMADVASPGQGIVLRLATIAAGEARAIIGAEGSLKFGLTDEEADAALARLGASGMLAPRGPFVIRGFHAFGASNVREAAILAAGVGDLGRRAEAIASRHGLDVELLDAGGGLGIPYALDDAALDIESLGTLAAEELVSWRDRPALRRAHLLLEPGRWIVGPAGAYLCRVVRTKERAGRTIAITDGGIHHLARPALVGRDQRIVPVGAAAGRPRDRRADVVGPLCTGLDVLALDAPSPELRAGDLLAVLDAGAYGFTESMPLFLTHPTPAEIAVDGASVVISRPRTEPA
jgi:diaminopimelate decarboxylase